MRLPNIISGRRIYLRNPGLLRTSLYCHNAFSKLSFSFQHVFKLTLLFHSHPLSLAYIVDLPAALLHMLLYFNSILVLPSKTWARSVPSGRVPKLQNVYYPSPLCSFISWGFFLKTESDWCISTAGPFPSPADHFNGSRVKWSRPYVYERMGCVASYSLYLCMDFTLSILLGCLPFTLRLIFPPPCFCVIWI